MREDLQAALMAKDEDDKLDSSYISADGTIKNTVFMRAEKLKLEQYIPPDAQVIMVLSANIVLLSTGLLNLDLNFSFNEVKSSEIVSYKDIRGSTIKHKVGLYSRYEVEVDRNTPANWGGWSKPPLIFGIVFSNEYGRLFMARLSEMLNGTGGTTAAPLAADGPLEKISKLKALLDADAITQEEFDIQKAKLLEQM